MDFESLKEQLLDNIALYRNRIEDSEIYINLKERYENLAPNVQNVIKYGSLVLACYFLYSIPSSFVTSASEKMGYFEENRQLTRELIRAGRIEKTVKVPPPAPSATALNTRVENILTAEQVLPEQKMSIKPKNNVASKALVPKSIKQEGLKTSVKQLNLRQLVRVGESLNQIDSSKLMNLAIQADAKDPHYFTADFEVAAFSVPQAQAPAEKDNKKSKLKSKRKRGKRK